MGFFNTPQGHRCYTSDTDHAEVVRWLRAQAMTGFTRGIDPATIAYRNRCTCGVNLRERDQTVSLILTRDGVAGGWHFSICCVTAHGYRPYNPAEGEHWLDLLFGTYRFRVHDVSGIVRSAVGAAKDVHHFRLECDWNDANDPVTRLSEMDKTERSATSNKETN